MMAKKAVLLSEILSLAGLFSLPFTLAADKENPKAVTEQAPLRIPWFIEMGQALTEARKKNVPILIFFEAPDQVWSRRLAETFNDGEIVKVVAQTAAVRLNSHTDAGLLDRLGVHILPDIRVFSIDGEQLGHASGDMDSTALKQFIESAINGKPEKGAASLSSLLPGADLDSLLKLEDEDKIPEGAEVQKLLALAGGPEGETKLEAKRLLRQWLPKIAGELAAQLGQKQLKPRLMAYETLQGFGAPLSGFDPWSGPFDKNAIESTRTWAAAIKPPDAQPAKKEVPATGVMKPREFSAKEREEIDADLRALSGEDTAQMNAARERLFTRGPDLVPILRQKSREISAHQPGAAYHLDELRFRLLLPAEALRNAPGSPKRLASGSAGTRAAELETLLKSGGAGLEGLAREAACDIQPLFRETAIRNLNLVTDDPGSLLRDTLADPEASVRTAALSALAASGKAEDTGALTAYLKAEKDTDMICRAIQALSGIKTKSSAASLMEMLKDTRWQVRAAAIEALGKLHAIQAMPDIAALLDGDDGFVAGRAVESLAEMGDESIISALERAVKKHPGTTMLVLKILGKYQFRNSKDTDRILRSFTKSESPDVRAIALLALARDAQRPAYAEVVAGLKDSSVLVRDAALQGLCALMTPEQVREWLAKKQIPEGYTDVRDIVTGLRNDPDEKIRLHAAVALCYFGDWEMCQDRLKECLLNPNETIRQESFEALVNLPAGALAKFVKLRLDAEKPEPAEFEWLHLCNAIQKAGAAPDSKFSARNDAAIDAMFEVLPRLSENLLEGWCGIVHSMTLGALNTVTPEAIKAFADSLEPRIKKLAPGKARDAVTVLWISGGALDEKKLDEFRKNSNPEIRRAAYAAQFRQAGLGPEELVLEAIKDHSGDVRAIGVMAAIPNSARNNFMDPLRYDIVAGEKLYTNGSTTSYSGDMKVIQLPVETLESLLKDENEDVRVETAVLMALEGGEQGLSVLAKHLKTAADKDSAAMLLTQATVLAWDDDNTPYLEKAYAALAKGDDDWRSKNFIQQIKPLRGPKVKALRLKIRKERPGIFVN